MCQRKVTLTAVLVVNLLCLALAVRAQNTPRSAELNAQFHRAETAWRSGTSMLEAKARVDRVLKELPDDFEARLLRAEVLLALNRPKEALADADHAVSLKPSNGQARVIQCEAARLSGDKEKAFRAMDAAAECIIDDPALHVRLSWNAVELDLLDRAEAFARIALAQSPRDAAGYYQLARIFILQDKPDNAAQILQRGFKASLLDPALVEQDQVLSRVTTHDLLKGYFR